MSVKVGGLISPKEPVQKQPPSSYEVTPQNNQDVKQHKTQQTVTSKAEPHGPYSMDDAIKMADKLTDQMSKTTPTEYKRVKVIQKSHSLEVKKEQSTGITR